MQTSNHKFLILPLALLIAFSPTLSHAEEREDKSERGEKKEQVLKVKAETKVKAAENEDEDDDKENKKEKKSCVKAFDHLISSGFMKKNDEANIDFWKDCVIPFGIIKKLNRSATTTPDMIAPTISRVAILTGTSTISVKWKTNERATSTLYYSSVNPLSGSASSTSSGKFSKDHLLSMTGLNASSTYYLRIESADKSGNATSSSSFTATTR